jgi:hypothetical protein
MENPQRKPDKRLLQMPILKKVKQLPRVPLTQREAWNQIQVATGRCHDQVSSRHGVPTFRAPRRYWIQSSGYEGIGKSGEAAGYGAVTRTQTLVKKEKKEEKKRRKRI